ncbi:MAG: GHKL domain-containing protein [Bacteroidia bacterium]|nr:GHKL domain-containing protein [Bacteroidia bacterium]
MSGKLNNKSGFIVAGVLLVAAIIINAFNSYTTAELCEAAQKNLHAKENKAQQGLQVIDHLDGKKPFETFSKTDKEYLDYEGISLFAFKSDSLIFWSSNVIPEIRLQDFKQSGGMLHLRNGWYEYLLEERDDLKKLALIFIKPEYDVQNNYFDNAFASWLQLPTQTELRDSVSYLPHAVKSINNKPLFEIFISEKIIKSEKWSMCSVILFFISLVIFVFYTLKRTYTSKISLSIFLLVTLVVVGIRALMIYFKWPGLLSSASLFMPGDYGNSQSFFNEFLGDILINVFLFLAWASLFYKCVEVDVKNSILKLIGFVFYFSVLIGLALFLNATVKNLVFNSTIPFEFSNFFNLNELSFLCLSIVFLNGFSIAILIEKFIELFFETGNKKNIPVLLMCLLVYSVLYFVFKESFNAIEWFWLPTLFLVSFALKKYNFTQSILSAGFRVLIFAIITSWLFSEYNSAREKQNTEVLADKLSDRQDAILENEFSDVAKKIRKDLRFKKALYRLPLYGHETEQQLRQNYFTGYFEKFNIQLAVFDSVCMPYFKNSDLIFNNNEYFEDQVKEGFSTISDNLFFMEGYKPNSRYVGKIEFDKPENHKAPYVLYVQLEPKQFSGAGNFPDLLLDEGQQKQNRYKQISYAVYKQNKLTTFYGAYDYPAHNVDSVALKSVKSNFKHYFVTPDKETLIVLSTKIKDFNYFFTTNSYYFIFYSLLGLTLVIVSYRINNKKLMFFSLNRRIQVFTISILFFALLAVGIFTVKLVVKKSEADHVTDLVEKSTQISNELNTVLLEANSLDVNGKQYAESVLKKYASLFSSDISLYNNAGILFASSRPQLFDAGLCSRLINPLAISNFAKNESSNFSTRDKIGSLNYLSLYTPLYNTTGNFIGYMNLPYFARQSDLEEGLSDYITTLLNVYVVLFLVSLFTGLVVTTYVTKPLRIVQQQLAKISLGKRNEPIEWQSNDEIGRLVNEYNQMLVKLEESATLLAKSEREGAWQEMAKQVAHEIKNPLTPMKLNLQYLQKVVNEGGEDFEGKFKKVSSSMIEQIDTLAHIANEFSNFAKMPKVNLEQVNLTEVIQSTIELFKNEQTQIILSSQLDSTVVLADKNQCLRVFNNIIKNAVQAIPEGRKGKIEIVISSENEMVLVTVKDNGTGIADSMKEKIFVPNFTTKSTGTGLGLAMVKNIIIAFGGQIWFESKENTGTIFYLTFRK